MIPSKEYATIIMRLSSGMRKIRYEYEGKEKRPPDHLTIHATNQSNLEDIQTLIDDLRREGII